MEFSRQEYWSELPFPSPGGLPNPGIEPGYPALQTDSLLSEPLGKSIHIGVAGNTWRGEDIGDRGWASASMGQTKCLLLRLMRLLPVFLTVKETQRGSWTRTQGRSVWDSVQFSSVAQSCPTLCDPMNRSTPGLPVHHQLPEFTQTHVHQVSDAIQPSHPLSSPSPPVPNPSQHQSLFQWVNSSHEVAKVLEFQLQHQSFQRTPRTDLI